MKKTFTEVVEAAERTAKRTGETVAIISGETHDGKDKGTFAVCDAGCCDRADVYAYVHPYNGIAEGPKAQELPVEELAVAMVT